MEISKLINIFEACPAHNCIENNFILDALWMKVVFEQVILQQRTPKLAQSAYLHPMTFGRKNLRQYKNERLLKLIKQKIEDWGEMQQILTQNRDMQNKTKLAVNKNQSSSCTIDNTTPLYPQAQLLLYQIPYRNFSHWP